MLRSTQRWRNCVCHATTGSKRPLRFKHSSGFASLGSSCFFSALLAMTFKGCRVRDQALARVLGPRLLSSLVPVLLASPTLFAHTVRLVVIMLLSDLYLKFMVRFPCYIPAVREVPRNSISRPTTLILALQT